MSYPQLGAWDLNAVRAALRAKAAGVTPTAPVPTVPKTAPAPLTKFSGGVITEYVGPTGLVPGPAPTPRNQPLQPIPVGPTTQPILLPTPSPAPAPAAPPPSYQPVAAPMMYTQGDGTAVEVKEASAGVDVGKIIAIGLAALTLLGKGR